MRDGKRDNAIHRVSVICVFWEPHNLVLHDLQSVKDQAGWINCCQIGPESAVGNDVIEFRLLSNSACLETQLWTESKRQNVTADQRQGDLTGMLSRFSCKFAPQIITSACLTIFSGESPLRSLRLRLFIFE